MNIKQTLQGARFTRVLYYIGALVLFLAVFQAGIFVGYRKAAFSYHGGERYYSTFGEDRSRPGFMGMRGVMFPGAHGVIGKIMKIDPDTIMIEGPDNVEKLIRLSGDTRVMRFRDAVSTSTLILGESIIVVGAPNEYAEIDARLIRVLPDMPPVNIPAGSSTQMGMHRSSSFYE